MSAQSCEVCGAPQAPKVPKLNQIKVGKLYLARLDNGEISIFDGVRGQILDEPKFEEILRKLFV